MCGDREIAVRADVFIAEQLEQTDVVGAAFLCIEHSYTRTTYYRLVYRREVVRLWADEDLVTLWRDLPILSAPPTYQPGEIVIPTPLQNWAALKHAAWCAPSCGSLKVADGTRFYHAIGDRESMIDAEWRFTDRAADARQREIVAAYRSLAESSGVWLDEMAEYTSPRPKRRI